MDPSRVEVSGPRATGRGGKARHRLGLKKGSVPAAPTPGAPPPVHGPPATHFPAAATPSPTASAPATPTAPTSLMPPRPPQGAGWAAMPPDFASVHGNQQGPNSWIFPPGFFQNMLHQPNYPPQPQGENFHLGANVGLVPGVSPLLFQESGLSSGCSYCLLEVMVG